MALKENQQTVPSKNKPQESMKNKMILKNFNENSIRRKLHSTSLSISPRKTPLSSSNVDNVRNFPNKNLTSQQITKTENNENFKKGSNFESHFTKNTKIKTENADNNYSTAENSFSNSNENCEKYSSFSQIIKNEIPLTNVNNNKLINSKLNSNEIESLTQLPTFTKTINHFTTSLPGKPVNFSLNTNILRNLEQAGRMTYSQINKIEGCSEEESKSPQSIKSPENFILQQEKVQIKTEDNVHKSGRMINSIHGQIESSCLRNNKRTLAENPKKVPITKRNARERNRVKQVSIGFAILREHVPYANKKRKLSKVETLRGAVEYIKSLQSILQESFPPPCSTPDQYVPLPANFQQIKPQTVQIPIQNHIPIHYQMGFPYFQHDVSQGLNLESQHLKIPKMEEIYSSTPIYQKTVPYDSVDGGIKYELRSYEPLPSDDHVLADFLADLAESN